MAAACSYIQSEDVTQRLQGDIHALTTQFRAVHFAHYFIPQMQHLKITSKDTFLRTLALFDCAIEASQQPHWSEENRAFFLLKVSLVKPLLDDPKAALSDDKKARLRQLCTTIEKLVCAILSLQRAGALAMVSSNDTFLKSLVGHFMDQAREYSKEKGSLLEALLKEDRTGHVASIKREYEPLFQHALTTVLS